MLQTPPLGSAHHATDRLRRSGCQVRAEIQDEHLLRAASSVHPGLRPWSLRLLSEASLHWGWARHDCWIGRREESVYAWRQPSFPIAFAIAYPYSKESQPFQQAVSGTKGHRSQSSISFQA